MPSRVRQCSEASCWNPGTGGRGLCTSCYRRLRREGRLPEKWQRQFGNQFGAEATTITVRAKAPSRRPCKAEGCDGFVYVRGFCRKHGEKLTAQVPQRAERQCISYEEMERRIADECEPVHLMGRR